MFPGFWLCSVDFPLYGSPLNETGHIWGFQALSGEHEGVNVEGGAEAYFRRVVSSSVLVVPADEGGTEQRNGQRPSVHPCVRLSIQCFRPLSGKAITPLISNLVYAFVG